MITEFDPTDPAGPTAVSILAPFVAQYLVGWRYFHGSLKQINAQLDDLPAGGRALCVNDLTSVRLKPLGTGASTVSFAPTVILCIKSNEDDSPAVRDGYTREAIAAARALLYQLQRAEGITVTGDVEGETFLDLFDAEVDGADFAFRFDLANDRFNYCALAVPTI